MKACRIPWRESDWQKCTLTYCTALPKAHDYSSPNSSFVWEKVYNSAQGTIVPRGIWIRIFWQNQGRIYNGHMVRWAFDSWEKREVKKIPCNRLFKGIVQRKLIGAETNFNKESVLIICLTQRFFFNTKGYNRVKSIKRFRRLDNIWKSLFASSGNPLKIPDGRKTIYIWTNHGK